MLWLLCALAVPARAAEGQPAQESEKPTLLVSSLQAQGASPEQAAAITDAAVQSLSERKLFKVISEKDLQTIVGAERQRQILGLCSQDEGACASGMGEAVGARFVLSGALSRLGTTFQLSLQMLDTVKGQPVGRSTRLANDLAVLREQVPYAVAEATGAPLPPPPSRVGQIVLLSTGGAALLAGGFSMMLALSRQAALNDELCPGGPVGENCHGANLRPRDYYVAQDRALASQKSLSIGLMAGGAVLTGLGVYLMPSSGAGPRLALGPAGQGVGLAGVFP